MLNSRIQEKVMRCKETGKVLYGYVYIIVDYTEDGKRKQKPFNTGVTIQEYHRGGKRKVEELRIQFAREWEEALAQKRGLDMDYADLTVMQMLLKYADDRRIYKKLSDCVYESYQTTYPDKMRAFLKKRNQEDMKLSEFTEHHAEAFMDFLRKTKTQMGTLLTDCTIKKYLCYYKPAFKYAKRKKWVKHNAFEDIASPTVRLQKPEFFSRDEVAKLWNALETESVVGLPLQFAFWTGMRRSELVGLKWKAVDLESGKLRVEEKVLKRKGIGMKAYTELKTDASYREIPLAPEALELLQKQRRITDANKQAYLYDHTDSAYVFVDHQGKLIKPDRLSKGIKRLCEKFGIKGHMHKTRHTFASHLRKSGADLKTIQDLLGHAHYSITADFYMGVDDDDRVTATNKLSQHFNLPKPKEIESDQDVENDALRIETDDV